MSRLITLRKSCNIHELVELMLKEDMPNVRCSAGSKENPGKIYVTEGEYEVHIGSWMIKNDKLFTFTTEEVEGEPEKVKA